MKFELDEILTIIDKVKDTELALFEYEDQDSRIKIKGKTEIIEPVQKAVQDGSKKDCPAVKNTEEKKETAQAEVSESKQENIDEIPQNLVYVVSPIVGTFYAAPSQDGEPFVKVGDIVKKGQTVGIVEAMKLMNEIEAECDGVVKEILVKNEQLVEYGQSLVGIVPENGTQVGVRSGGK